MAIKIKSNSQNGYIALTTVLILGAVSVTIATAMLLLGLGYSRSSFTEGQATQARFLASACLESSLREIKNSVPYVGIINLNFSQGSCSSEVVITGGQTRSVTASGTVGGITKKVELSVTNILPKIIIGQWQEIQ